MEGLTKHFPLKFNSVVFNVGSSNYNQLSAGEACIWTFSYTVVPTFCIVPTTKLFSNSISNYII